jgi:DNA-binding response OmpR family regulator
MSKPRILITEDERIIALDIKQVLLNNGFDVVGIVSTGKGAIKKVKDEKPDLVLMDIILNGPLTGIETAEIITREMGTPIIFITALDLKKDSHYDSITKKYTCLKKPFNELELSSAINENLKLRNPAKVS